MNLLQPFETLANRYFAMRHGHSLANQAGLIVSRPANGVGRYGLSETGRGQVGAGLSREHGLDRDTLILSSDFRRARESAEIAHSLLGCLAPPVFDERLRERDFGAYELGPDSAYEAVWKGDETSPDQRERGVESVNQVMARVTSLVADCESRYSGLGLLLVSHGDALQILQTAFARRNGSRHRELAHLNTAEVRRLRLSR